jgi:hypothetical protein
MENLFNYFKTIFFLWISIAIPIGMFYFILIDGEYSGQ